MYKRYIQYSLSFGLLISLLVVSFFVDLNLARSQSSCPSNTQFTMNSATLVGEVSDNGGDPNMTVWFEWGTTISLGNSTPQQSVTVSSVPYRFCANISNLTPCTTYYYRAVGRNSAGTVQGGINSFTTVCQPVSVDLKINGSNGPLTVNFGDPLTLSWVSSNANSCTAQASPSIASWNGNVVVNGSQALSNLNVGTYNISISCAGQSSSAADSVQLTVRARMPIVITLPPVQTL